MDLRRAQLGSQREAAQDAGIFGDVVRLDAEVLGDRGIGDRQRIAGVRPGKIDEDRPGGRRAGIAARGAIGPDEVIGQDGSPVPRSFRQNIWIGS
jgi:hypothetical protein